MQETGVHNGAFGADKFGLKKLEAVNWNLGAPELYEHSLRAGEAVLTADGALCAETGVFTGRSPKDKFTVRDAVTDKNMWWAGNQSITSEQFSALHADFLSHAEGMTLFAQDLYGGADPALRIRTRVFTELAWHSLFIRTLLIRPEASELADFVPELTIIDLPSFKADPKRHGVRSENVVAIDFARKIVLIGGSYYAGEMKKSVFTTLNYYLPEKGVMPMHCSANVGARRRHGDLLRPVGHRQDHAVGGSEPDADRRRRAWLGRGRRLQFRRRLLRQMHQAVERSRAGDLRGQQPLRRGAGKRGARTPGGSPISTTAPRPRTPVRPIPWISSPMPPGPAARRTRRTW